MADVHLLDGTVPDIWEDAVKLAGGLVTIGTSGRNSLTAGKESLSRRLRLGLGLSLSLSSPPESASVD